MIINGRRVCSEYIASIDADGTHDPKGLAEALKVVESGKADFVLGNRMSGLTKGSMQLYLLVRFQSYYLVIGVLLSSHLEY